MGILTLFDFMSIMKFPTVPTDEKTLGWIFGLSVPSKDCNFFFYYLMRFVLTGSGLGNISSSTTAVTDIITHTPIPTVTPPHTPTATVKLQRQKCKTFLNSSFCSGQYGKMNAIRRDGYCVCTGQDYDHNTCLRKFFCGVLRLSIFILNLNAKVP